MLYLNTVQYINIIPIGLVISLNVRDKVIQAAEKLAQTLPFDRITYAEIAKEAGVHWTAVRRHLGGRQEMRAWLKEKQAALPEPFADTRTRILEAGVKVFAELGFHQASLDKVAAEAGLTKGAVYWHFSGKQDLFLAILEHQLNKHLRMLPGQMEQMLQADDPASALADWLASQLGCLDGEEGEERRPMLFLEFVTSSREPEVRERLQAVHGKIVDGAALLLEEMRNKGLVRTDADPGAASIMIDALLKGLVVEWLIDPGRFRSKALFREIANMLLYGMLPQTSRGS